MEAVGDVVVVNTVAEQERGRNSTDLSAAAAHTTSRKQPTWDPQRANESKGECAHLRLRLSAQLSHCLLRCAVFLNLTAASHTHANTHTQTHTQTHTHKPSPAAKISGLAAGPWPMRAKYLMGLSIDSSTTDFAGMYLAVGLR